MRSSDTNETNREVMTTVQVAERLKISAASVRRLMDDGVLAGFWTAPDSGFRDVRGFKLRGHRRIFADAVAAYEAKRVESEAKSTQGNS